MADLDSGTVHISQFQTLPVFANNSRKCAYKYYDSVYIYDFESGSKIKIGIDSNFTYYPIYTFSPDDQFVLYMGHYFSLQDSVLHDMQFNTESIEDWLDDSTILAGPPGDRVIHSFNFITGIWDTILIAAQEITAFSNNRSEGLLYYSPFSPQYTKIFAYNPITQSDSLIFDPLINDPNTNCWENVLDIKDMEWSDDDRNMAFFNSMRFVSSSSIYVYKSDIDSLYHYTYCFFSGYRNDLRWLGQDTLIYSNANTLYIEGFALDHPLAVDEQPMNEIPETFSLSAYPNPFNSSATIKYSLFRECRVQLLIYDMMGQVCKELVNDIQPGGVYEVIFNAENFASGIYFYQLRTVPNGRQAGDFVETKKIVLLR